MKDETITKIKAMFKSIKPCPTCASTRIQVGIDDDCEIGNMVCVACGHRGPEAKSTWEAIRLWNEAIQ
jgi:hypothetical protein